MLVYQTCLETIFELQNVPHDLRATLLLSYLNAKAKESICRLAVDQLKTYDGLKTALLREFKLTPHQHRMQFNKAIWRNAKSYMQFNTRLNTMFKYYFASCTMKDLQDLTNLIVADKLKDTLPHAMHSYIVSKKGGETFTPSKSAELADLYENEIMPEKDSRVKGMEIKIRIMLKKISLIVE